MRIAPPHPFSWLTMLCLGILGAAAVYCGLYVSPTAIDSLSLYTISIAPEVELTHPQGGIIDAEAIAAVRPIVWAMAAVAILLGVFWLVASGLAMWRKPVALRVVRAAFVFAYGGFVLWQIVIFRKISQTHDTMQQAQQSIDLVGSAAYWWSQTWPLGLLVVGIALLDVASRTRSIILEYTGEQPVGTPAGDRIIEDLRTFGRDPKYRKSVLSSSFLHLFIIVLLPILMDMFGCVENYRLPKGSGDPVVQLVVQVKPKKKPKKRFILNPNTDIIMHVPDLEDSQVLKEVNEESQDQYQFTAAHSGKTGKGGGKEGGWPKGSEDSIFRFIRLEYRGQGWEDGMAGNTRADQNFLAFFKETTGFKTRRSGESHPISYLNKYDKGFAPPFVYMTGDGRHIGVSGRDMKILREYLVDGGMLIADAGSPEWHRAFEGFIRQVIPEGRLVTIADDDPIFQRPFVFPNGAPPLWHHGGMQAKGVKLKGRWVVFYHPGDLNDAWKDPAYVDLPPDKIAGAKELGVNLVYYAVTQYLDATEKYRK